MQWPPTHTGSARALVIEDDPVTREFLSEALECAGWKVEAAKDAASALLKAQRTAPDLVLCDVRLPDGDAFDIARTLWPDLALPLTDRPYAVALSAELDDSLRARLHRAGYRVVLSKPLSMSSLLAALPAVASASNMALPARDLPTVAAEPGELAELDDAAALAVCGNRETVEALRRLLAGELAASLDAMEHAQASGDTDTLRDILHRLRSSCGFCGALALGAAVADVRTSLDSPRERALGVARVFALGRALMLHLGSRSTG